MELKKINRKSKEYKNEYTFFYVLYIIFSCIIFSISEIVVFKELLGIASVAIVYAFINSEIFGRANFGFYGYQAVSIPILIIFVYFQYQISEFIK